MIDPHDAAIDTRKTLAEWKAKRNWLFDEYLKNPSNTLLALEIKAIDDQIAEAIERSTAKRPILL
jgi:hypothetical protein